MALIFFISLSYGTIPKTFNRLDMKKIYSLFFFCAFTLIQAQITQSFNEPVIGETDRNYRLDTSAYTSGLPVGVSGNSCVWDYSKLAGIFPMVVDSFIAPSAALGTTAHPTASYVQHRDLLYTFFRSTTSPPRTELLGAYSPSLAITFTNAAVIADYPVNYGYFINDPVSGSFKYNTITGACNGNIIVSASGTGTIILAGNVSFQNVICLRSVEMLTLSTGIAPIGTFYQTFYNYYAPGKKFPVLSISYTGYQVIGQPPAASANVYGSNSYFGVAGVNESELNKEDYRAFPNPFHDYLTVNLRTQAEENEYLFYNAKGQLVLKTNSLTGDETDSLLRGIYFLEIRGKSGIYRQKVIKD